MSLNNKNATYFKNLIEVIKKERDLQGKKYKDLHHNKSTITYLLNGTRNDIRLSNLLEIFENLDLKFILANRLSPHVSSLEEYEKLHLKTKYNSYIPTKVLTSRDQIIDRFIKEIERTTQKNHIYSTFFREYIHDEDAIEDHPKYSIFLKKLNKSNGTVRRIYIFKKNEDYENRKKELQELQKKIVSPNTEIRYYISKKNVNGFFYEKEFEKSITFTIRNNKKTLLVMQDNITVDDHKKTLNEAYVYENQPYIFNIYHSIYSRLYCLSLPI